MKTELRDEVTRTLGTVAEQAGYERGLLAALEAVQSDLSPEELEHLSRANEREERDGVVGGLGWPQVSGIARKMMAERIERLLEEAGKERGDG